MKNIVINIILIHIICINTIIPIENKSKVINKNQILVQKNMVDTNIPDQEVERDFPQTPIFSEEKIGFIYPITGTYNLVKKFSENPNLPFYGILLDAGRNSKVLSSSDGKVIAIDHMEGYGTTVFIEHGNSYFGIYGNLRDVIVKEGDIINQGVEIGSTGFKKSVYFQLNKGQKAVDPLGILRREK